MRRTPYDKDQVTCSECLTIAFLPFYIPYMLVETLVKNVYRSIREANQAHTCNHIIKRFNLSEGVYRNFYLCYKVHHTHVIIHVRPPCRVDRHMPISVIINELWLSEPRPLVTGYTHFVLSHVNSPSEITEQFLQTLEQSARRIRDSSKNTILITDNIYKNIWTHEMFDHNNRKGIIRDFFDVIQDFAMNDNI